MQQTFVKKLMPLLLVLFIDSMGMGLFFPVLSSLIIDPSLHFLAGEYSIEKRQFIYGVIISVYMFSWFFGAAILGDVSDFIGRKKSLLICLGGAVLGYVVAGISIAIHSIALMIIGRLIAGFTAGSQAIAQAAIVDISDAGNKSRNMSWMVLTLSLGFLMGPIIGGILSSPELVSWFNYTIPMYFAAFISLLNIVLLSYLFNETFIPTKKFVLNWFRAIEVFISAFKHRRVRNLSIVLLFMEIGWGAYFSFIVTFMVNSFHFTALQSGLFLSLVALGFSGGSGILVPLCLKWMSLRLAVVINFIVAAAMIFIMVITQSLHIALIVGFVVGANIAVCYSNLLTLLSNQVSPEEQGWVMGMTGSVGALCFAVTSLLGSVVSFLGLSAPMIIGAVALLVGGIILWRMPLKEEASNII
jgi:DHA1 family tetracycline resistance protein-like MFS transporter